MINADPLGVGMFLRWLSSRLARKPTTSRKMNLPAKMQIRPTMASTLTGQRVPGQSSGQNERLDTATRMMIDADFSLDRELPRETRPADIRTPVNKRGLTDQK
jgi:hypothetical protein